MDRTKVVKVYSVSCKTTVDRTKSENNCDVSVVSLSAVQNAARRAMVSSEFAEARDRLLATQKMLDRCATTDEQQEEYDIYIREVEKLDDCLRELTCGTGKSKITKDQAMKVFFDLQAVPHVQFQAGSKKDVSSRKKHVGEYKELL